MEEIVTPAPPASDEAGETSVDIHKPKPVHGWRELASEIGVITIGILIALAGEQIVEALHWREKVAHAHHALEGEIYQNYFASVERIVETPCIVAQLATLKGRVLQSGRTLRPAPPVSTKWSQAVLLHSSRQWDESIWQGVTTEQVDTHFDEDERQEYALLYNSIAAIRRLNEEETASDGALDVLAAPLPLDASLRGHLIEELEGERERALFMALIARQQIDKMRNLLPTVTGNLHDPAFVRELWKPDGTSGWCRAHGLPLAPVPTS